MFLRILGLEVGVFRAGGEAGARLGYVRELTMVYDAGLGIVTVQLLQELIEGVLLLWSASIGSLPTSGNAALVTDSE